MKIKRKIREIKSRSMNKLLESYKKFIIQMETFISERIRDIHEIDDEVEELNVERISKLAEKEKMEKILSNFKKLMDEE